MLFANGEGFYFYSLIALVCLILFVEEPFRYILFTVKAIAANQMTKISIYK